MVRSFCQRMSVATGIHTERAAANQAISISPDHPYLPGAWLLALGVLNPAEILLPISGDNAPGTDVKGPHGMDAPEPRLWTGAPEQQIGGLATTRQLGCRERRLSSADPPKVRWSLWHSSRALSEWRVTRPQVASSCLRVFRCLGR